MIELFEKDIKTTDRKSSKGNQLKFERDGVWYKADNLGYEGLAECVVSDLLHKSSLQKNEFAEYDYDTIEYNKVQYKGCKSADFTDGWKLITLERLFAQIYGTSLNRMIYSTENHTERLKLLVELTERITGITGFGTYLNKLLTVDALFLNEDRHTHNIAILMNDKRQFRLCPIFDNGGALLSDTSMDYPLGRDIFELISRARPKTICDSFEEQLEISEKLYGNGITFSYTIHDIENTLQKAYSYGEEEKERVLEIILQTRRKYGYLFRESREGNC